MNPVVANRYVLNTAPSPPTLTTVQRTTMKNCELETGVRCSILFEVFCAFGKMCQAPSGALCAFLEEFPPFLQLSPMYMTVLTYDTTHDMSHIVNDTLEH